MIHIDLRSREPIYEQLVNNIKELIFSGILQSDEKLPSVRELASQLTINPNTIQKAYKELENLGYIYSARGRGNFVMPVDDKSGGENSVELLNKITELVKEANYVGISKKFIIKIIDDVYRKNIDKGGIE
ncbi:GntR family transcriptional regulator [Vallitalea sp. AN17-2]|uniref:GntR family transcriptional regulator n=1 Tax=Vallitalea maricola TaxID=3074433 RepID=A0ACB5UPJ9_9FIRM|nr:GntR family transcriptional regulator [Vallitalea sp. AN17-2]